MKTAFAALALAACGGGVGDDDAPMDTAQQASVMVVTPCAGENATIVSLASRFDPMSVTITMGQIVKLVAEPTGSEPHDIMPALTGTTDPALVVPRGETRCFRFTAPGTYNFRCAVHGFLGSVVVN
jgi:plastocyanin